MRIRVVAREGKVVAVEVSRSGKRFLVAGGLSTPTGKGCDYTCMKLYFSILYNKRQSHTFL